MPPSDTAPSRDVVIAGAGARARARARATSTAALTAAADSLEEHNKTTVTSSDTKQSSSAAANSVVNSLREHYKTIEPQRLEVIERRYACYAKDRSVPLFLRDFKNLNVLDIGSGSGVSSQIMARQGNKVTAVDPDLDEVSYGVTHGIYDGVDLKPMVLQDLPAEYNNSFDVATYIFFLVPYAEREAFFKRLVEVLKPDAKAYLVFAHGDYTTLNYNNELYEIMKKYFSSIGISRISYGSEATLIVLHKTLARVMSPISSVSTRSAAASSVRYNHPLFCAMSPISSVSTRSTVGGDAIWTTASIKKILQSLRTLRIDPVD